METYCLHFQKREEDALRVESTYPRTSDLWIARKRLTVLRELESWFQKPKQVYCTVVLHHRFSE